MKNWNILHDQKTLRQSSGQANNIKHITEDEIIKILLRNRGLVKKKEIEEFLYPDLEQVTAEKLNIKKTELKKATVRIKKAIKDKESIVVYTDYDVDGVCAGAIIWETLHNMGAKIMPYVPHRVEEGYGLSQKGIEAVIKLHKPSLIITVDHGITAADKIEYLKKKGIDTIIIDHHLIPKKVPKSIALVHTTSLCATGVAWFFAKVLKKESRKVTYNLDLVALATIADLIPLIGPSRTLVTYGLIQLNKTDRIGLDALITECSLQKGNIGVYEIGHILAPRINAMGRLTHAIDALRLLCTKDKERAEDLSRQLVATNSQRQIQTTDSVLIATEMVKHQLTIKETSTQDKLIFISEERFTQGVIGLIASRLVDSYYRPAIVISEGKEYSKASARSIAGFNIVEAINKAGELLVDVGGHPMAAGFTIETRNLTKLREKLMSIVAADLPDQLLTRVINIDLSLKLTDVKDSLYKAICKLSPFGIGNPEPVFATAGVTIEGVRLVGKDRTHIKLFVKSSDGGNVFEAIGFGMGKFYPSLTPKALIDIAYTINEDRWNGNSGLQLKLKDVKIPGN